MWVKRIRERERESKMGNGLVSGKNHEVCIWGLWQQRKSEFILSHFHLPPLSPPSLPPSLLYIYTHFTHLSLHHLAIHNPILSLLSLRFLWALRLLNLCCWGLTDPLLLRFFNSTNRDGKECRDPRHGNLLPSHLHPAGSIILQISLSPLNRSFLKHFQHGCRVGGGCIFCRVLVLFCSYLICAVHPSMEFWIKKIKTFLWMELIGVLIYEVMRSVGCFRSLDCSEFSVKKFVGWTHLIIRKLPCYGVSLFRISLNLIIQYR